MKPVLLILLLSVLLFVPRLCAAESAPKAKLPLTNILSLLSPLREDAIELGSGPVDVYVFIDPRCPHSRDFVTMITDSDKMRRLYHYYFFLYALPMFKSEAIINAIYSAPSPKTAMLAYMVEHRPLQKLSRLTPPAVHVKIARINKAAERIGVNKRPYLILDKKEAP